MRRFATATLDRFHPYAIQYHSVSSMIIYGIKNCDKVRALRKKLEQAGQPYTYRDFRDQALSVNEVSAWLARIELDSCINRRSTSWKSLSDEQRSLLTAAKNGECAKQAELLSTHPTLFKRPIMEKEDQLIFGYTG